MVAPVISFGGEGYFEIAWAGENPFHWRISVGISSDTLSETSELFTGDIREWVIPYGPYFAIRGEDLLGAYLTPYSNVLYNG